jgi:hypothetical protein
MLLRRYMLLAVTSGCLWAAFAWLVGHELMPITIWGGLLCSPIIALGVAFAYWPLRSAPPSARAVAALVTLYLAVAMFGAAVGLYDAFVRDGVGRLRGAVALQSVLATLWWLTFSGAVLVLWPVSMLNHWILCRAAARPALPESA